MITSSGNSFFKRMFSAILLFSCLGFTGNAAAQQTRLEAINFVTLPGEQLEIELSFNNVPPTPAIFEIANPARLSMDFNNVSNQLNERRFPLNVDVADSAMILEDQNRTRW